MIQKIKKPVSILLVFMMIVSLFAVVPFTASATSSYYDLARGTLIQPNDIFSFEDIGSFKFADYDDPTIIHEVKGSDFSYNKATLSVTDGYYSFGSTKLLPTSVSPGGLLIADYDSTTKMATFGVQNITHSFDETTGTLTIGGSGVVPNHYAMTGTGASGVVFTQSNLVKHLIIDATDMIAIQNSAFMAYNGGCVLEDVKINSTSSTPLIIEEQAVFYRSGNTVTVTVNAVKLATVTKSPVKNYNTPVNLIYNVEQPITFKKNALTDPSRYLTVTFPTHCNILIPGGAQFTDSRLQEEYDDLAEDGDEEFFWDMNSDLVEGTDYVLGDARYEELTPLNVSLVVGNKNTALFSAYTITDESVNGTVTASVNGTDVTEAAADADVLLTVAPAEGYQFVSISSGDVSLTTVTEGSQYSFTMPAKNITVKAEFEAIPTYTVTWLNDDGTTIDTTSVYEGDVPTHADPTKAEDENYTYTFAGWTPEITAVTGDVTYTATFTETPKTPAATASYVKVTSEPDDWSGDYLIVYEDEDDGIAFNGSADGLDSKGNYIDVTISGGEIASDAATDAAKVTIAQIDGGYSIATATGAYIGGVSGQNKLASSDVAIVNTISLEDDSAKIVSNTSTLRFNFTWSGFRYYRTVSQKPVQLYKLTGGSAPATYTVTWKNGDDVLETDTDVAEGTTPTYDGETPTKANDDYHSYNFSGWTDGTNTYGASDTLPAVTGDVTYTAKYTVFTKQFTVFVKTTTGKTITANGVSGDTTVAELKDMVVEESGIPAAEQRLIFAGKEMENEKTLADYRIQRESTLHVVGKSYTITWKNDDGTVIDTTSVAYGETPTHADPTKAATAQYTYTFAGWSPEITAVTGDAEYTATYDSTVNEYTVTWKNDDGTVIDTTSVAYGETPTHADAAKAADAQYTYTFAGWSPEITAVTGDVTYTAVFDSTVNEYTVTWKNDDGSVIDTTTVEYGETPTHADAAKAADAQYTYTFAGWSPEITAVTGDVTYTAVFDSTVKEYTVLFKTFSGYLSQTDTVAYGTIPVYSGREMIHPADMENYYVFTGWTDTSGDFYAKDAELPAVTGDETYTATFEARTPSGRHGFIDDKLYINDVKVKNYRLVEFDGDYYFISDYHKIAKDKMLYVNQQKLDEVDADLLNPGDYYFGTDGKMVIPNGLIGDYYYVNGAKVGSYYGLVEVDGDYYYIGDYAKIVKNKSQYLTTTNGLTFADGTPIPHAYYSFDADGKMIIPNGLVGDYYYVNGVKVGSYYGLVKVGSDYYYVGDNAKIVKNKSQYLTTTNDLTFADGTPIPHAYYSFDADGKMIIPNGIVGDYYYINGVKVGSYYGLVEFEGDYYYVSNNAKIVKNRSQYLTTTNDLTFADGTPIPHKYYQFDADGKMVF